MNERSKNPVPIGTSLSALPLHVLIVDLWPGNWALYYAADMLKSHHEFILEVVAKNGRSLRYASEAS
eukprot:2554460-Amphidinium_carterae.1